MYIHIHIYNSAHYLFIAFPKSECFIPSGYASTAEIEELTSAAIATTETTVDLATSATDKPGKIPAHIGLLIVTF